MSAHSNVVGGSSAERVLNCPGSVALVNTMPPTPSSTFADEGSMLHEVMERLFKEEDVQVGFTAFDNVLTEDLWDEMIAPALDMYDQLYDMDYYVEQKMAFPGITDAFGTADVIGRDKNVAYVVDWKFGRGVQVSAVESKQGMFYAACALTTDFLKGVTEVEITIIQPAFGEPSVWRTTPERIEEFRQSLIRAVELSKKDDAPMKTGKWCKWCAAKAICPEQKKVAEAVLVHPEISADDLQIRLKLAEQMIDWAKGVQDFAHQQMDAGTEIPGYKLVAKRATRKWEDEAAAEKRLKGMRLTKAQTHTEPKLLSPAQIEKICKKADKKFPEDMVIKHRSPGTTLVPESDKRPAIMSGTASLKLLSEKLKS